MYCTKCGGEIPEATDFCVFCGQPVQGVKMQPAMRSVNNGYVAKKPKIRIPGSTDCTGNHRNYSHYSDCKCCRH